MDNDEIKQILSKNKTSMTAIMVLVFVIGFFFELGSYVAWSLLDIVKEFFGRPLG